MDVRPHFLTKLKARSHALSASSLPLIRESRVVELRCSTEVAAPRELLSQRPASTTRKQLDRMTDDQSHLQNHEIWRRDYRQTRYLNRASDDALDQRFKDVVNNLTTLTPKGQVGVLEVTPSNTRWMILFTHLLEEYEL